VVGPGGEGTRGFAKDEAEEDADGGDERSGPTAAEVRELGDGLGEDDLVGVALEVTQDGRAEDGGDDDAAKEGKDEVDEAGGEGAVEQDLVVAGVDEVVDSNRHEAEREEQREVDVGREALRAELELKCKEFPELCHVNPSVSLDAMSVFAC
jgi:hypothetical protein